MARNASTAPHSVQVNVRFTDEAVALFEQIAVEEGLLGGPGLKPETPNISKVVRFLAGKADPRYRDCDLSLEWDRNG